MLTEVQVSKLRLPPNADTEGRIPIYIGYQGSTGSGTGELDGERKKQVKGVSLSKWSPEAHPHWETPENSVEHAFELSHVGFDKAKGFTHQ